MNTNQNKQSYALPIAMMFALFFMIAFVTGLQNPMGVIVKNQFQASNLLSQLGNFANFIAYAFMGIPAGLMLQKIGYKKTALTAILVGIAGVAITFFSGKIESFAVYLIGAFVGGFSMCMLNTVVNPMLNTLGGEGKRGNQLLQFGGTIVFRHIMPMCLSSVIVRMTLDMAGIILTAAGLGFIGLGAQPPLPEWGAMISTGRKFIFDQWWVATMPGFAIFVVSLGFNLLGDAMRDLLDPHLRRRA